MGRGWGRTGIAMGVAVAVLGIGTTAAGQPTTAAKSSPLVGRWQKVTTCQQFVQSLRHFGLEKLAPRALSLAFIRTSSRQMETSARSIGTGTKSMMAPTRSLKLGASALGQGRCSVTASSTESASA